MTTRTIFYIRSKSLGLFVGECMGLGFFEAHKEDGTLSEKEEPIQFETKEMAQKCIDSWVGGSADCFIEEGVK